MLRHDSLYKREVQSTFLQKTCIIWDTNIYNNHIFLPSKQKIWGLTHARCKLASLWVLLYFWMQMDLRINFNDNCVITWAYWKQIQALFIKSIFSYLLFVTLNPKNHFSNWNRNGFCISVISILSLFMYSLISFLIYLRTKWPESNLYCTHVNKFFTLMSSVLTEIILENLSPQNNNCFYLCLSLFCIYILIMITPAI